MAVRERRSTRRIRRWRLGLASGCAGVLCLAILPGASADGDDDETYPSRERVREAQEQVQTTADRVDAIEAELVAADQQLESLSIEAAKAVEAYNGARYRLQQARVAVRRAERTADAAAENVRRLEGQVASSVVTSFENGGALPSLGILMDGSDPDALLEQLDAYDGVTGAMETDLDDYESAKVVADVLEDRAEDAFAEQEAATEEAEQAKEAAESAVAAAQDAVSTIAAEKDSLVRQLAAARNISVDLARERQVALAEQAREEAAEAAQEEAEQQAEEEQEESEPTDPPADDNDPPPSNDNPPPDNDPPPDGNGNPPPPDDDPPPGHGASAAIAYAKDQLGEPYVYGAAGPDSWDCSGLTMEAWAAAGVSLSHWSVAQYYETTPISFSDLRRGDLLFWGETDDPDTIYHVAMYLGDGTMIQAPRPGRSVEIVSIYYWILPNFYTRV